MATRILNVVLRIALLTALVASVVMFVDYGTSASPVCGAGGGCAKVRDSGFSHIGPVSLPTIGIGAFAGLFAMAIWASRKRHHLALTVQTGLAAAGALGLIGLQLLYIGAVCPWCMVVDTSAIVAFGVALYLYRRGEFTEHTNESVPLRILWGAAGVTAIAVPMLWNYSAEANVVAVPKPVAKYQQPGKVNVVMFTDFQCPHCEKLHDALEDLRPGLGDKLNLVRMMVPLEFHPGAKPSALAYLCMADDLREKAAHRFYKAGVEELTPSGVVKIGKELGADPDALSKCMSDKQTLARMDQEQAIFRRAELSGVPTSYVNAELIRGADIVAFKSALHRAQGGDGGGSDITWMFVFIALVVGGAAAASVSSALSED